MTQKVLFMMIGLLALTHIRAQAEPTTTASNALHRTLVGTGANALYAILQTAAEATETGQGKKFATAGDAFSITCRQDLSGNSACAISLDRDQMANGLLILTNESARDLYAALGVKEFAEMVSDVKIFTDADETVSILCARSIIPNGNPYSCSIELPAR